ncbi:hypothetical protein QA640_34385 [Bradyrhizobium sp. CB82]|uniref:hypothetical protein n=1 Tax=Bradyrhizobium sp. CB82 TaxID=3039159 RepID=UPI0024B19A58|nr:hypothetical protein [Bradyrhizobium sp. CB82]WFU39411.1 hypothetical protein QA640_34385 [Bradyrhizobium sp. CB82]
MYISLKLSPVKIGWRCSLKQTVRTFEQLCPCSSLATFCRRPHYPDLSHFKQEIPVKRRALALTAFLCASAPILAAGVASAADLSISPARRSASVYGTGSVFWDDVYPPAIYGPHLRSVEEVSALKAARRPVSSLWSGYDPLRLDARGRW